MKEVIIKGKDLIEKSRIPMEEQIANYRKNKQLSSILRSHGGNHHYYNYKTGITIVSRHDDGKTYIGIAKCGNDDKKDPDLGYEIALHRTQVKPYSIIGGDLRRIEFHRIAQVLNYHVHNNSQWSQKALDRIDV